MNASIRKQIRNHAMFGTPEERARFIEEDRAIYRSVKERAFYRKNFPGKDSLKFPTRGYTLPASLLAERAQKKVQKESELAQKKVQKESERAQKKVQKESERAQKKVSAARAKVVKLRFLLTRAEAVLAKDKDIAGATTFKPESVEQGRHFELVSYVKAHPTEANPNPGFFRVSENPENL